MNNHKDLSKLFNGVFYRIPDYQRGYSWGQKQLEDFWEDLENSKGSKSKEVRLEALMIALALIVEIQSMA